MEKLNQPGVTTDPGPLGDRLLLLEPQYDDLTQTDVARTFGTEFAESIVTQPTVAGSVRWHRATVCTWSRSAPCERALCHR